MISYTYQILSLRKYDDTLLNIIKSFKLRITGVENGESHYVDDKVVLDTPSKDSFVEYENIKEENLISWYENGIREEIVKYEIQQKFYLNKGNETDSFPWV